MTRRNTRLRRTGTAALVCLALGTGPLAAAPASADENNPIGLEHTAEKTEYADDTPAMYWNVRDLFMQISGGADTTLDGATAGER
ncbi:hypothetical protein OS125_01820 [Corynebacterium sp. P7003]|uniref:Uncharacterized protein n=1 Tax=Corynebacterium pygosceleis TaxID=2800406 RepID=A0ABT3WPI8_9CORY|nr:hypothetical protein [Corynebacterium pygosceleis]MCX7443983.1 hypothetical protein [Corynebacterium pygosceleis]